MDFNSNKPIYLQIVEYVYERILQLEWKEDHKVISVRDLATELEVNPNTVMRAYEKLQNDNIIYNKRGIGFFVVLEAATLIKNLRKESFIQNELKNDLYRAKLLGITQEEIINIYNQD
ncbi:GntR family transcriptional regulator [Sphingobacterium bovistauri]|uniref:GntR family transcriptional regulator n=1 Tax=Sphingobacterium bovistauri TaxID=2781959 RepID=A0ABS7Z2V2_9SPHI|nr:GntR family transcriptional regulator [Sphingobacterium bovistauri]MCA5004508.1 GntR family transcriptional regulator [Sphingobacterium bovistauri]